MIGSYTRGKSQRRQTLGHKTHSYGCERGMEEVDRWDDGERPLVTLEENDAESSHIADPLETEMVAVTSGLADTEAQVQGSPTPIAVRTPDPSVQIPEMVPETSTSVDAAKNNPVMSNDISVDALQASLNNALVTSEITSTLNVGAFQNPWTNMSGGHFLSAPLDMPMLAPISTTLSEQERAKLMTDMIINCIRRQTSLWDSTDPKFGDSVLCPLLWNNIASVCGLDVKKLKNKWSNLKTTYKKEFIKSTTKGVSSKSPNFAAMSFLEGEVIRELQRRSNEKEFALQKIKRFQDSQNRMEAAGSPVLLDSGDDEDGAEDDEDCVIVESEQYRAARNTLCRTLDSGIPSSSAAPSGPITCSTQETAPKPPKAIRVKDASELTIKRPHESSQRSNSSSHSDRRSSPEVVCLLEESSQSNPKKVLYSAAVGNRPTIKFSTPKPINLAHPQIVVGEGMPKNWNVNDLDSTSPKVIKRCARKSTSRASITLFSACNGEFDSKSTENSINLKLTNVETNNSMPWKIENPRTVDPSLPCVRPEQPLPIKVELPKPVQVDIDPLKLEPTSEEDEIQIIKEVPGRDSRKESKPQPVTESKMSSAPAVRSSEQSSKPAVRSSEQSSKLAVQNLEQTPPLKKPRLSDSKAPKRKIDKTRENSANEHFLLSLLCDVETLTNKQFRRLKKHSTSLASMILDSKK